MSRSASLFLFVSTCVFAVTLALGTAPTSPAHAQDPAKYMGPEKCKMCHSDQHATYLEMKHSKAWETLKPEDIAGRKDFKDRPCIQCHTTGYGKPNGFVSLEETPQLINVGCESCHGPGSVHMSLMVQSAMMDGEQQEALKKQGLQAVSRNTGCDQCHDPHVSHKKLYGNEKE